MLVNIDPTFDGSNMAGINTVIPAERWDLGARNRAVVLGQLVPYWPYPLRNPDPISALKPGVDPGWT
ncbi:hypothetical protein ATL51_1844 [Pseudonocardia alni]|uniref:Uncharacterized protein n=1 Tax=Pseudonocardia alni TaxID=33907 RepID=A0AA44ZNX6_PSEA5|nr:hypothetical protein ATL51_1844 [Pseudonocardia alni]